MRNELKVKLYQDIADTLQKAQRSMSRTGGRTRNAITTLRLREQGVSVQVRETSQSLARANTRAARGMTDVLLVLEKYEIVFARFSEIRRALSDSNGRLLESHRRLHEKLMLFVPLEGLDLPLGSSTAFPFRPTKEALQELEDLQTEYLNVTGDIAGYYLDIQVEAQNELLGPLFKRAVPPRKPGDPSVMVLRRDAEALAERAPGRWA